MGIEDTSRRDPLIHAVGSMGKEGFTGYVTGMEAAGQRQVVNSTNLPLDGPWEKLEALGFLKGEKVDDLFVEARIPEGWTREGSGHAMWSYLHDERGVKRVGIFYKAAFYDRKADMHLIRAGLDAGNHVVYGDEPEVALPEHWDVFTEEEREDFRQYMRSYLERHDEHPDIYKEAGRARRALELAGER